MANQTTLRQAIEARRDEHLRRASETTSVQVRNWSEVEAINLTAALAQPDAGEDCNAENGSEPINQADSNRPWPIYLNHGQLNHKQREAAQTWAADDRLWTTQETVEFNLLTFARAILAASGGPQPDAGEGKAASALRSCYMLARREMARRARRDEQADVVIARTQERLGQIVKVCEQAGCSSSVLREPADTPPALTAEEWDELRKMCGGEAERYLAIAVDAVNIHDYEGETYLIQRSNWFRSLAAKCRAHAEPETGR